MQKMLRRTVCVPSVIALIGWWSGFGLAQVPKPVEVDMSKLTDAENVRLFNRALTVTSEDGRVVARLDARAGDGSALIEGSLLAEGIIEVDLKGRDMAQRSFLGIAFHVVDTTTFDAVYFRPFNFRAAAPEAITGSSPSSSGWALGTMRGSAWELGGQPPKPARFGIGCSGVSIRRNATG